MEQNNIIGVLNENLADFDKGTLPLVKGKKKESSLRYGGENDNGYQYSQKNVIENIDLILTSTFRDGQYDSQGHRKLYLNTSVFRAEVAEKMTDVDLKHYLFIPNGLDELNANRVDLMKRRFLMWAKQEMYGRTIDELNRDYSRYGTCVAKVLGKRYERVSLRTLRNTQDAKSLEEAINSGGYVILEHEMTVHQMKEMPEWNTKGLKFKGRKKVYEMYTLYPKAFLEGGEYDRDDQDVVRGVAFLAPELEEENQVLYTNEVPQTVFTEAHWQRFDGRWLGYGEVEKQFENQIATNTIENLRRRHLLWAAKKVFQSKSETIAKNLDKDVRDGQVLEVGPNGEISQVDMSSRFTADFNAGLDVWNKNAEQKSFTFEVATGESLPSGTPFRLGVILSNAMASYFDKKRENFGMFLEESFFKQIIPIFKRTQKEHQVAILASDPSGAVYRDAVIEANLSRIMVESILAGKKFDKEATRQMLNDMADNVPSFVVEVPKGFYDDAEYYLDLEITGETIDIPKEMETLTTLYTTLVSKNPADPRADRILNQIISLTGKAPNAVLGKQDNRAIAQQTQLMQQTNQGVGTMDSMANLGQPNAVE